MEELVIKNLTKKYKITNKESFTALSDINLSFNNGELVSIVGESGSGKSTLMNLIGGLDSDFEGDIIVSGQSLHGLKEKEFDNFRKNKVGFVFQSFNLIPHLSVLENVSIAMTLSGAKEKEKIERATQLLTRLGLKNQIRKKPNQLSGGQKQRVAIARALVNNPDIILADEPTGALDSATTLQILDILKEIADEGKLVIMVTHSEKVASISSRVVEISDGKIIRDEQNTKYQKSQKEDILENKSEPSCKKKKKQTLKFSQALKLAFHNMWASKAKNLLMAFGVAISISSLMLMLSFGSGLGDYINQLAADYANPLVVSISKTSEGPMTGMISPPTFTYDEAEELVNEINTTVLNETNQISLAEDVSYGLMQITGFSKSASFTYDLEAQEEQEEPKPIDIFAVYTTPATYTDSNIIAGRMSGDNEVMFSPALLDKLDLEEEISNGDEIWPEITLNVMYPELTKPIEKKVKITGIVDTSVFNDMLTMYIDYDYLDSIVKASTTNGEGISPSTIYIRTANKETTDIINNYVRSKKELTGSIEERLARMFTQMTATISTALTIIACISLVVAAIMILVVLYISVSERTREIGVLKSIGARRRDIKSIFTSESFLIGLLSGILGIALSMIFYLIFYLILNSVLGFVPLSLKWWYFVVSMAVAIFISMFAGLYPSAKAAKLDPVESLRRE